MFEVYTAFFCVKYLLTLTRKCGSRRGVFPKKVFFFPGKSVILPGSLTFPMSHPRGSGFDVMVVMAAKMLPAVDIELVAMVMSMKIISRALIHTRPVRVDISTSIGLPIRAAANLLAAPPPAPPVPQEC